MSDRDLQAAAQDQKELHDAKGEISSLQHRLSQEKDRIKKSSEMLHEREAQIDDLKAPTTGTGVPW